MASRDWATCASRLEPRIALEWPSPGVAEDQPVDAIGTGLGKLQADRPTPVLHGGDHVGRMAMQKQDRLTSAFVHGV